MSSSNPTLTEKQRRFCEGYLISFNATEAYIKAGYRAKNENVAAASASDLLRNPKIQVSIQSLRSERSQRVEADADAVLREISQIAFSNITDVIDFGPNGCTVKDSSKVPSEVRAAVAEISCTETERGKAFRVKMHDKLAALNLAARHTGLTNDLNQALATFRRYGYILQKEGSNYRMVSLFCHSRKARAQNACYIRVISFDFFCHFWTWRIDLKHYCIGILAILLFPI